MAMFFLFPVAGVILIVTVVMSLIAFSNAGLMEKMMLVPERMLERKNFLPFITSGMIHADAAHLLFNMLTFYFFAFSLEGSMGHWQFAVLYLAGMVLADIPSFIRHHDDPGYASLGASGAVSAVVFGYILYHPLDKLYIMFLPVGIPAIIYAVLYLLYCVYASRRGGGRINHSAHFWGSLAGIVITIAFDYSVAFGFIAQIAHAYI